MSGTTIFETLITLAIVSVMGLLLSAILLNNNALYHLQSAKVQQGVGINDALTAIRTNIKNAYDVSVNSSADQLILKSQSLDINGNTIPQKYDYIVYLVDNGILKEKIFPDDASQRKEQDKVIVGNVDKILFTYFDQTGLETQPSTAGKIKVSLTLKHKIGISSETNIATSEAYLRNKFNE